MRREMLLSKAMAAAGSVVWLFAVWTAMQNAELRFRGEEVSATVTGTRVNRYKDSDGMTVTNRYTQYRFDHAEKSYVGETRVTGIGTTNYSAGTVVPVLFLPESPEESYVDDFGQMWLGTSLLVAGGVLLMLSAYGTARWAARQPTLPGVGEA
jgi:hypothetical protein